MREFTKEELNNEVWKDIPDYEGIYQISNLGRVMSIQAVGSTEQEAVSNMWGMYNREINKIK